MQIGGGEATKDFLVFGTILSRARAEVIVPTKAQGPFTVGEVVELPLDWPL